MQKHDLPEGYYWVKVNANSDWEVAVLEGNDWVFCVESGSQSLAFEMVEVVGPRILPPHMGMTPEEFERKMRVISTGDFESDHRDCDSLMCELLESLGYGAGVKLFQAMTKWYS